MPIRKMIVADVTEGVEKMRAMAADSEAAHAQEDRLRAAVLRAIANGRCDDPQACAAEALETDKIRFTRCYTSNTKTGCLRSGHPQREPHPCPYRHDIYDDKETLCTCCEDCEHECLMDI